uniref:Uncharacterized protein n=1 Tax=Knipowitschia caucasica TaxID=637954 RepID=A0AAV2KTR1_KNICA
MYVTLNLKQTATLSGRILASYCNLSLHLRLKMPPKPDPRWRRKKDEALKRYRRKRCHQSQDIPESANHGPYANEEDPVFELAPCPPTPVLPSSSDNAAVTVATAMTTETDETDSASHLIDTPDHLSDYDELLDENFNTCNEESADENVDFNTGTDSKDGPLYANAPLSVAESLILIMTFAKRHKLTGVMRLLMCLWFSTEYS